MSATEKQIAFIEKLSDELGNDRTYNFATMSVQQASDIIEELIDQKQEADFAHDYMGDSGREFEHSP